MVRKLRGWSLQEVAEPAKISVAYLQKLEKGKVNNPSPKVLQRLAEVLEISYLRLMQLAAYLPEELLETAASAPQEALKAETLSDTEWRAVFAFIRYLKEQR